MESKSMWTVAMLGFCAVLLSGVFAFINMGYMKETQKANVGVKYGRMSLDLVDKLKAQSLPIEETEATFAGEGLVELRYKTRRFLSFAPDEMEKEFVVVAAAATDMLPTFPDEPKFDARELLLIRQEITGGGCNEQVRQSTKLVAVPPRKKTPEPAKK
jgi:hypothetical protein